MITSFSAREASRLAGFNTTMMLNYLERSGVFTPELEREKHHGKKRCYTYRDLVVLRALNRMLLLGVRPKRLEQTIRTFLAVVPKLERSDDLEEFCCHSSAFVVTGSHVLFCADGNRVYDLAAEGQLAFAFMVVPTRRSLEPVTRAVMEFEEAARKRGRHPAILDGIAKRHNLSAA